MVARILLIDGDDETRQRSAAFLRSVGFHVIDVPDAHGATELARVSGVHIVVSDMRPRGAIDGIEVVRRLHRDDSTQHVRVVMLTAGDDEDGRAQAREVGCRVVLERGCDPAALASEIRRIVSERPDEAHVRRNRSARMHPAE